MKNNPQDPAFLPIRINLSRLYAVSLLVAVFITIATVAGLLYQTVIYPTDELLQAFLPNDVTILFIGLPMLLGSMWLAWRGKLIGLLFWPGALFFVVYSYLVYIFAMPFNLAYPFHLALVMLSVYALIVLLACIDAKEIKHRLTGAVPERLAGGILAGLGLLFFVRIIAVMVNALIGEAPLTEAELALNATDFLISPAWVICGILLWRRNAFGYVAGLGLLFQASMLFIGLIIIVLLLPFITNAPFALVDVVVILIMGLVCFIPFGLFARGVVSVQSS
jgi:hypothetical protein